MDGDRLNQFQKIREQDAALIFTQFDSALTVLDIAPIRNSMSNSNYIVATNAGKYLLKLYSNSTDVVETMAYSYLRDKINVPDLLYYDNSKRISPYVFTILEYIDGNTLLENIRTGGGFSTDIIREIGRMSAVLHSKTYSNDALFDKLPDANIQIPNTHERILILLSGRAGSHLQPRTANQLRDFIETRTDLFDQIEQQSVFCHGDLNYSNILIKDKKVYFIDFEFAYAGSRYHDIGHFFRRKDDDVQSLIGSNVYDAFADGYKTQGTMLPDNWLTLAQLCDIAPMLCLLDRENPPAEWVSDIEHDILHAICK